MTLTRYRTHRRRVILGPLFSLKKKVFYFTVNKSPLDNSPPPLLNLKLILQPQGQIIDVKCKKSQLIGHFDFFSAIIILVRELVISNMPNKFGKDRPLHKKLFMLSRPQDQIISVKCEKSQ